MKKGGEEESKIHQNGEDPKKHRKSGLMSSIKKQRKGELASFRKPSHKKLVRAKGGKAKGREGNDRKGLSYSRSLHARGRSQGPTKSRREPEVLLGNKWGKLCSRTGAKPLFSLGPMREKDDQRKSLSSKRRAV